MLILAATWRSSNDRARGGWFAGGKGAQGCCRHFARVLCGARAMIAGEFEQTFQEVRP